MATKSISIGSGSAWSGDRLEPARDLAESGRVDYLAFDCLAERTIALAQSRRMQDEKTGHDQRIAKIVEYFSAFIERGGRIIGNFGAANPDAAVAETLATMREGGIKGVRLGLIRGDDVFDQIKEMDVDLPELDSSTKKLRNKLVSAHAYIGAEPIVELLQQDAQFIIGGRLADPSLFVGPICHELDWALDDWPRLGTATLAGHLLECGMHGAGGNFADPPYRTISNAHDLPAPFAEIKSDRDMIIEKLETAGGAINEQVVKTQLLYEIHDPANYLTPDVTADFSQVTVEEVGPNKVRAANAQGAMRPDTLKVLVGIDLGWKALGEISYGGPGCVDRMRAGSDLVRRHLESYSAEIDEIRYDAHGLTALFGDQLRPENPTEVRLRVAARCSTAEAANAVADEVEHLYFGPAGGGGVSKSVSPFLGVTPAYIPRHKINLETEIIMS